MSDFPISLDRQTLPLNKSQLSADDAKLLDQLEQKGYQVQLGLDEVYASQITQMSRQTSIKEFCPKDSSERFSDLRSTQKWLAKGRQVFLLVKQSDNRPTLAGYGWSGAGINLEVPAAEATFALRIGEAEQGKGLSTTFARLILAVTISMYSIGDFWLETWQSDGPAVHVYHKLGFSDVSQIDSQRKAADGKVITDKRLYMKLSV